MNSGFAAVLHGLMHNRRLSARIVSRTSGRAESTINQLLNGSLPPNPGILQDLAPVLQVSVADLLVIAGLPPTSMPVRPEPYLATREIGRLVALASHLTPQQVDVLIEKAVELVDQDGEGSVCGPFELFLALLLLQSFERIGQ